MYNNLRQLERELKEHYTHIKLPHDKVFYADLSDVHVGHKGFDIESFKNTIAAIKEIPNFYVFLGGDTLNHANKGSKSSQFEENMTPREQMLATVEMLDPIKHKIIGSIDGNHDGTRAKEFNDISPKEILSDKLGIKYYGDLALVHMSVGANTYSHFHHHITGATGKKMNLNKLQEKGEEWRLDVVWGEHTHRRQWGYEVYVDICPKHYKPRIRKQYYINANSFLGWSGYAKTKGYRIGLTGIKVVELGGIKNKRYIKVHESIEEVL